MARSLGPKCKQCRREGMKLFLKGERCLTEKCAVERRSYPPGEDGRGRMKESEYRVKRRRLSEAARGRGRRRADRAERAPPPAPREAERAPLRLPRGEAVPDDVREGEPAAGRPG